MSGSTYSREASVVFLLTLVTGTATAASGYDIPEPLLGLYAFLLEHPLLAPLLFVLAYALAVMAFLPGPLFCLLGGALFGPWLGTVVNMAGATLGAALAFLIARYLAADLVERHLNGTLRQVKQGVEEEGWRFVALIRLLPVVPYDLTNYAFGVCRIPLGQFVAANVMSLLPRVAAYSYIGYRGRTLLSEEGDQLLHLVTLIMALAALWLLPPLYHRLRQPAK